MADGHINDTDFRDCMKAVRVFRAHLQGHFPPARPLQTLQRKSQAVQGQVLCQSKRRRGLGSNSRQAERTPQRRQMHHNTPGNLVWLLLGPFDINIREQVVTYHWRGLSQVSFLSRQKKSSRQKTCFVEKKKKYACRDKIMFVATKGCLSFSLSRQNTSFIATKLCKYHFYRDKHVFVATKVCPDKHNFVATKDVFCRDKHILSRQTKTFVVSKMILMAAPASVSKRSLLCESAMEASVPFVTNKLRTILADGTHPLTPAFDNRHIDRSDRLN